MKLWSGVEWVNRFSVPCRLGSVKEDAILRVIAPSIGPMNPTARAEKIIETMEN